ncbi:invasion associated locus B family protein [Blastochloris tepida]|nr:invasion associated locus B family protein [Blastochloris tepida]
MMFPIRSALQPTARRLALSVATALLAIGFVAEASAQTSPAQPVAPKPVAPKPGAPAAPNPGEQAQAPQLISSPWTKLCSTDPEAKKEICLVTMELRAETGQFLASVLVRETKGEPKKTFAVVTPLTVQLQPGFRVVVEKQQPVNGKYTICFPNGCFGELEIDAEFVKKLKGAQGLAIQVVNQTGRPVSFPISLAGFGKAYDGAPLDPKAVEEQQKKLQDEMQKRAEELRKKLLEQGGGAPSAAAPK